MGIIRNYRVIYIGGRFGGGKTSLAFRLAYDLLTKHGYRYLLTNVPSPWADRPEDVKLRSAVEGGEPRYADVVCILDEAGLFLRYGRDADAFLAFLRKLNIILLLPSYEEPAKKLQSIFVQRSYNLSAMGIPVWWYNYKLTKGFQKDVNWFAWLRPSEIFGVYDTDAAVVDDAGLNDWFDLARMAVIDGDKTKQRELGIRDDNHAYGGIGTTRTVPQMEGFGGRPGDQFEEAADVIEQALSVLGDVGGKGRR